MIKEHTFNTNWWGEPVGLLTNPAFFNLKTTSQQELLQPFAWVEFRHLYNDIPLPVWGLTEAGFTHVDTQVRFKIDLNTIKKTSSLAALDIVSAAESPFTLCLDEIAPFKHERFSALPRSTPQRVNKRYVDWANDLIAESPQWCVKVQIQGEAQGWFLSRMEGNHLNLTLAVLRKDASISGMHLYHKSLYEYARRGARIAAASYSVTNREVMHIYAALGARYLTPEGFWLWTRK